ncbi:hypothetical protein CQA53_02335 [Helicobacter didelphidarum]|uniref:Uncharacterized protein n=1 Tax=Helicobacter didelphidarum TaxID=2040648 RepID=A0A3D8IR83_9HELI|nr:hypothetical protein [Helicobacter didelphidarum]RDU67111.1 hypothetical protein CQA53_02335 [Helicobacter didelphidarum]
MKTFKEILTSQHFFDKSISNGYCTKKTLNFIIKSHNLQPLLHFIRPNIKKHILAVMVSKKDSEEILVGFKSHPVCIEFNKFHAKELLYRIHAKDSLAKALNLQEYKKIRGYVSKSYLQTYTIKEISEQDFHERANGDFINHAKIPEISNVFEEIRDVIKLNKRHIQNLQTFP